MPLIVAVEPDRRQASQLKRLARGCAAELVLADTTERAIEAIGSRTPDLVLVPALLSPQDDAALATALRVIAAAAHVQTLTIPVFAAPTRQEHGGGVLSIWRRGRTASTSEGCDPAVFGEQIAAYLAEAAAARQALEREEDDIVAPVEAVAPVAPAVEAVSEWDAFELPAEPVEAAAAEETEPAPLEAAAAFEPEKIDLDAFITELEESRPIEVASADVAPEPAEPVLEVALEEEQEPEPVAKPVPTELWAALSLKPHRWPQLDAVIAEARATAPPPIPEPEPVPVQEPVRAAAPRLDWVDMLDALRRDIDRLRTERTVAGQPPAPPAPTPPVVVARPAPPRLEQPAAPGPSRKHKRKKEQKPLQDEWGFFDPQQCGFTALLAKLDEISDSGR